MLGWGGREAFIAAESFDFATDEGSVSGSKRAFRMRASFADRVVLGTSIAIVDSGVCSRSLRVLGIVVYRSMGEVKAINVERISSKILNPSSLFPDYVFPYNVHCFGLTTEHQDRLFTANHARLRENSLAPAQTSEQLLYSPTPASFAQQTFSLTATSSPYRKMRCNFHRDV